MPTSLALVVEDSAVQRQHLVQLLGELGFSAVLQASDGASALDQLGGLGGQALQLLITDIDMPGIDGIELLNRLSEQHHVEHVIVVSARDPRLLETVEMLGRSRRSLHLLGTLIKPVCAQALRQLLAQAPVAEWRADTQQAPSAAAIAEAVRRREFLPYFQPKVDLVHGRLKGVEALARWQHPERGLLPPGAFIGALEGTPLMAEFTLQIAAQALGHLAAWRSALPELGLSLNLAADNIADQAFLNQLVELCRAHGLPPGAVTWEVTETMIMNERAIGNLARLSLKGFGLSMDDFGVGYSSLQSLARSPFTEIKIDRQFVNGASERNNRSAILRTAVDMGRRLGAVTVAEGVETEADWRLLQELECDLVQGYLVARPMPAAELLPWAVQERRRVRELAWGGNQPPG